MDGNGTLPKGAELDRLLAERVGGNGLPAGAPAEPTIITASSITPRRVRWLWHHWLPGGALSLLDGDPGLGKSTFALDLTARVTRGFAMPPRPAGRDPGVTPADVLILTAEDSLEHTVRPRLDAAGADNDRVHFLTGMRQGDDSRLPTLMDLDADPVRAVVSARGVRLVVVDPFAAFLGRDFDAHKDQDIRGCLHPLSELAAELDVTVLLLRHLNKLSGGAALYRGGGSIGIIGAVRAALVAGRDPDDRERFIVAMNKSNLGPTPKSLAYRLHADPHPEAGVALALRWEGECDLTPADILAHAMPQGRPDRESREACQFLIELLADGPVSAARVREHADAACLAWRTVQKAKGELKIRSVKAGDAWLWELPAGSRAQEVCPKGADTQTSCALENDTTSDPFAGT